MRKYKSYHQLRYENRVVQYTFQVIGFTILLNLFSFFDLLGKIRVNESEYMVKDLNRVSN